MTNLELRPIDKSVAKRMIVKNHYSHKWTSCNVALGIFQIGSESTFFDTTDDKLIGVIVYGYPIGRNTVQSISDLVDTENVYELVRLWIMDGTESFIESHCIAKSVEWLKANRPKIKVIISYADPEYHKGTIYKASNFLFQQVTDTTFNVPMFSFDNGKTWKHAKTVDDKYGTIKRNKLPSNVLTKLNYQKFRFILPVGNKIWRKKLIASLKYPIQPYPKK